MDGRFVKDDKLLKEKKQFIPREKLPFLINPERVIIESTNQHPSDSSYEYYMGDCFIFYRSRRLRMLMPDSNRYNVEQMKNFQQDNFNLLADDVLKTLLSLVQKKELTKKERSIAQDLLAWDRKCTKDSRQAVFFDLWWRILTDETWGELKSKSMNISIPLDYVLSGMLKEQPDNIFFDIRSTNSIESAVDIALKSYTIAITKLDSLESKGELTWGNYKATKFGHLAQIPSFGRSLSVGGGTDILNATGCTWGPTWRMIVELTKNGPRAWRVYAGGQSGNPMSSRYDNNIEAWANQRYFQLNYITNKDEHPNYTKIKITDGHPK